MNLESWMSLELFHYSWKQWMHLTVSIDFHSIFFFPTRKSMGLINRLITKILLKDVLCSAEERNNMRVSK